MRDFFFEKRSQNFGLTKASLTFEFKEKIEEAMDIMTGLFGTSLELTLESTQLGVAQLFSPQLILERASVFGGLHCFDIVSGEYQLRRAERGKPVCCNLVADGEDILMVGGSENNVSLRQCLRIDA